MDKNGKEFSGYFEWFRYNMEIVFLLLRQAPQSKPIKLDPTLGYLITTSKIWC
jgi:hypothetical protein